MSRRDARTELPTDRRCAELAHSRDRRVEHPRFEAPPTCVRSTDHLRARTLAAQEHPGAVGCVHRERRTDHIGDGCVGLRSGMLSRRTDHHDTSAVDLVQPCPRDRSDRRASGFQLVGREPHEQVAVPAVGETGVNAQTVVT